jgi:hypothetical protein
MSTEAALERIEDTLGQIRELLEHWNVAGVRVVISTPRRRRKEYKRARKSHGHSYYASDLNSDPRQGASGKP